MDGARRADETTYDVRVTLEGLSDAVFAFAVTLLVVSLKAPKTFGNLQRLMHGFVSFAICFALLLMI